MKIISLLWLSVLFCVNAHAQGAYPFGPGGAPTWQFTVPSVAALPPAGNSLGDARIETTAFDMYVWDGLAWQNKTSGGGGGGTVTSVSVTSSNGFAGTVATSTTTPAITIQTTLGAGLISSDGANAIVAASSADVTGKLLTGFVAGAGVVAATDTLLQAFNKIVGNAATSLSNVLASGNIFVGSAGNVATGVAMSGGATITNAGVVSLTNASVTGQPLTGFVAGAGTVADTDTILQGFNKLAGNGATYVAGPASSTDNAITRWDGVTGKLVQDSTATLGDTGIMTLGPTSSIVFGSADPFARVQLWNHESNAVLRLGSWQADGDATSSSSEGIIAYGNSLTGLPISATDGGYARIKQNRFGLFTIDSSLPFYAAGAYYYRVDDTQQTYLNNAGTTVFSVQRASGNTVVAGSLTAGSIFDSTYVDFTQIATPANPAAGHDRCYVKSDDKFYCLNSAGTEVLVGPGSSGGGSGTVTNFSFVDANGFFSTVTNPTTTATLTLAITPTLSGVLKAVAGALASAVAGVDYQAPLFAFTAPTDEFVYGFNPTNTFLTKQINFYQITGTVSSDKMMPLPLDNIYVGSALNVPVSTPANAFIIGQSLTGFVSLTGTVTAADSILTAFEKLAGNSSTFTPTVVNTTFATFPIPALNIDWSVSNSFSKTLSAGAQAFTFSNKNSGQTIVVRLTCGGTPCTTTWPAVTWLSNGGVSPATPTINSDTIVTLFYDGTTVYGSDGTSASTINFTSISGTANITQTTIVAQAISALDIDWSTGNVFTKTLSANSTFTFSNQRSGQTIVVRLTNTAGNFTVTWPGAVKWSGGTPPVETVGAFSDVITFVYDGTSTYGSSVQNF